MNNLPLCDAYITQKNMAWLKTNPDEGSTDAFVFSVQAIIKVTLVLVGWLCWDLTTHQPLWVIMCHLPKKEKKEIGKTVEEMKDRDRKESGTGMKVKKQKK